MSLRTIALIGVVLVIPAIGFAQDDALLNDGYLVDMSAREIIHLLLAILLWGVGTGVIAWSYRLMCLGEKLQNTREGSQEPEWTLLPPTVTSESSRLRTAIFHAVVWGILTGMALLLALN